MKKWLNNHYVRLIAGNFGTALLMLGLPAIIIMGTTGLWSAHFAVLMALVAVHVAIFCIQFTADGTLVPTGWNAIGFVPLSVADAAFTVSMMRNAQWPWAVLGLTLTAFAAYATILIVKKAFRRRREVHVNSTATKPPKLTDSFLQDDDVAYY